MVVYHITNFFKETKPILTTLWENQNQQFHKKIITTQHWYPIINSLCPHGVDLCHNVYKGTKRKSAKYTKMYNDKSQKSLHI
jgi:hypothetical protein